jgi:hypothetical protein
LRFSFVDKHNSGSADSIFITGAIAVKRELGVVKRDSCCQCLVFVTPGRGGELWLVGGSASNRRNGFDRVWDDRSTMKEVVEGRPVSSDISGCRFANGLEKRMGGG